MRVKYSPLFLAKVKKIDVRIYKSLRKNLAIFIQDPNNPQIDEGEEVVAYFEVLGTHEELYGN